MFQQVGINKDRSLLLDAGALLFAKNEFSQSHDLDLARINAEGIIEAYNDLGYDAVGISGIDLAGGAVFLQQLAQKSQFPWISANLVDRKNGQHIFTPYIIQKKNGLHVAIFGLTGSGAANESSRQNDFHILHWQDLLPQLTAQITPQSDLVILLSSLPPLENEQIANQFPCINIIIQAGRYSLNRPPLLIDNTLICQTEKQGKYIGRLHINWNKSSRWADKSFDSVPKSAMETEQANTSQVAGKLQTNENKLHEKATFENTFWAIDSSLADEPTMDAIVARTRTRVNAVGKISNSDDTLNNYAGSTACLGCHEDIGKRWQNTSHAHAYKTLMQKKQEFNPACLPCHVTTGISISGSAPAPALVLSLTEPLHNVGCETCHGPGRAHLTDPKKVKLNKSPAAFICLQCHTAERDAAFQFKQDKELIH